MSVERTNAPSGLKCWSTACPRVPGDEGVAPHDPEVPQVPELSRPIALPSRRTEELAVRSVEAELAGAGVGDDQRAITKL
jgi:hypothetical protein